MKKILALVLAGVMVLSCVACGKGDAGNKNEQGENEKQNVEIQNANDILTKVWSEYNKSATDDWKFPIGGGNGENIVMDAPGTFDVTLEGAEDELVSSYCLPGDAIAMVDDVATAMNMMMANNFTTASYHVADAANVSKVVDGIKTATVNNRWMCGLPEKFMVATVGDDYVVSAFGLGEVMEVYKKALTSVYGDAVAIVVEENIAE